METTMVNRPILRLAKTDGNAFAIIGKAITVAKEAGWSEERIEDFKVEAMSGDYDNLLQACMTYFNVRWVISYGF